MCCGVHELSWRYAASMCSLCGPVSAVLTECTALSHLAAGQVQYASEQHTLLMSEVT